MLTVSQEFKTACLSYPVHNELDICVIGAGENNTNLHIYNTNIVSESMVIEQSVCDESDIKFGGAIASSFEIEVFGVPDLTGRAITVTITQSVAIPLYPNMVYPGEDIYPGAKVLTESFKVFTGTVFSCKLNKNHVTRKLVAYDDLYRLGSINCAEWYAQRHTLNSDGHYVTTVEILRKRLCEKYSIVEEYPDDELVTDNMLLEKAEGKITVNEILRCIGEIGAVFCFLNGDGRLEYHTISTNDTPNTIRKPGTENYGFNYSDCSFEEYERWLRGVLYRAPNGGSSWHGWIPTRDDHGDYILENNTLVDAFSGDGYYTWWGQLGRVDSNYQDYLKFCNFDPYRPYTLTTPCRLWVQLCDKITFDVHSYSVNNGVITMNNQPTTISSYVFSRRIKGIQAMTDEFSANAENVKYTEKDYEEGGE